MFLGKLFSDSDPHFQPQKGKLRRTRFQGQTSAYAFILLTEYLETDAGNTVCIILDSRYDLADAKHLFCNSDNQFRKKSKKYGTRHSRIEAL